MPESGRARVPILHQIKIPEAAGPRGAKDSGYFREAIANCVVLDGLNLFVPSKAGGQYDFSKNGSTQLFPVSADRFQKLATFRGDAQFYSWLFRIAMNASVNFRRKNRSLGTSIEATKERIGLEPTDPRRDTQPDQPMQQSEQQQLVREALSQMTEEFRIPLVMAEMEEMKYEEIADILHCPIGTVRSRIHRGRLELREKLRRLMKNEEDV